MTIYEKAAEQMLPPFDALAAQVVAAAVWDAIYACPQCDGTGRSNHPGDTYCDEPPCYVAHWDDELDLPWVGPCPAEHVRLSNPHSGEERWCKPDMAEWRCYEANKRRQCSHEEMPGGDEGIHVRCGWKPVPYEGNNE